MPDSFLQRSRSLLAEYWDDFLLLFAKAAEAHVPLVRFIYQLKRYVTTVEENGQTKHIAKAKAFDPPKNLKLSTFHTTALNRADTWQLDQGRAANGSLQQAVAAAHVLTADVIQQQLKALLDNRPNRHVTVVGWPDSGESARYEVLSIAAKLAAAAEIQLP